MTTNPVIKMMRSLSNRSFEDLKMTAENECISIPEQVSKVELITIIISARAGREGRDSVYKMVRENNNDRTRYRFREIDGTEHYVMLTPEQERFMRWNHDNAIDYDNIDIDVIEDIDWETP